MTLMFSTTLLIEWTVILSKEALKLDRVGLVSEIEFHKRIALGKKEKRWGSTVEEGINIINSYMVFLNLVWDPP